MAKKKLGFPPYVIALIVILGIALGFAGFKLISLMNENSQTGPVIEPLPKVKLILFYASECPFCDTENSIKRSFTVKKVDFEEELIDLSKEENKHYISDFNLFMVPSALVEEKTIRSYAAISPLMRQNYALVNGFYVVPESYLDSKPKNLMFFEAKCSADQNKVKVEEFADYYCYPCWKSLDAVDQLKRKFTPQLQYKFKNFSLMGQYSLYAQIAAECVRLQGQLEFNDYQQYLYKQIFSDANGNIDANKMNLFDDRWTFVQGGLGLQLTFDQQAAFEQCLDDANTLSIIEEDNKVAESYWLEYAPAFVIDCKYVLVGYENLKTAICMLHPGLDACKQE
ncbi:MAG: thioredoxin domain-containing protein [Candidatus Diapherotrites archaeon]